MFYRKRKAKYEAQIKELEKRSQAYMDDLYSLTCLDGMALSRRLSHLRVRYQIEINTRNEPRKHDAFVQHPMNGIMFQMEEKDEKN